MPGDAPASKAGMDPNFEKALRALRDHAALEYEQRRQGLGVPWFRPPGWSGDATDPEGMAGPFSRRRANDDCLAAIKDPADPGTTGDVVATTTMIDYLAVLERAFRRRHTQSRPRAMAHLLARKRGQGSDLGPFVQSGLEFARALLRQAKQEG